eukprot:5260772-Pleurochrysis_carterae.AAC.2
MSKHAAWIGLPASEQSSERASCTHATFPTASSGHTLCKDSVRASNGWDVRATAERRPEATLAQSARAPSSRSQESTSAQVSAHRNERLVSQHIAKGACLEKEGASHQVRRLLRRRVGVRPLKGDAK